MQLARQNGFTLIELSIVLVIIGLIVGGVLVGQDLIRAAEVRATISQIEKYNTAVNTFREKYGALPGDLNQQVASTFGFASRGQYAGEGDGNGVIEGNYDNTAANNKGWGDATGETAMFWVDLSAARLMEGSFNTASSATPPSGTISGSALSLYFPSAKLGNNYIGIWSQNGVNWFGVMGITNMDNGGGVQSIPGLTVQQAYSIDKKVDDGYPQTGNVVAAFVHGTQIQWTDATTLGFPFFTPFTIAMPDSSITCFGNGNNAGLRQQYTLSQNGGNGVNCALSFQFQ